MVSLTAALDHLPPLPTEIARLEERIRRNLGNRIRDLQVYWQEAGLVLQGCAASYHAKQLAQEAVMQASAWPLQANQIRVLVQSR